MVKLQKSLNKPVSLMEKKKKKVQAPLLATVSKPNKKDKQKQSLEKPMKSKKGKQITLNVQNEKVVAPVKKTKPIVTEIDKKSNENSLKKWEKKSKKTNTKPLVVTSTDKKKISKPNKRPLVLAPLESSTVPRVEKSQTEKKPKNKKKKQKLASNGPLTPLTKLKKKAAAKRAYKKQQLKKKRGGKLKKTSVKRLFEPLPYDEDKFNAIVNEENIKKIAKGLKEQVKKEVSVKKTAIFSDFQYLLNVACFKIPNVPKRVVKLNLKHSLVDKNDNVAIIVRDLQRGAKVDYEPTIQHFEDIFREVGLEGLTIIPFNKLRNECTTFETVRKFANTYDYFLCDGRLVGHASGFCGKIFQKPRTTFHTVRMDSKNIKHQIEKSLRRTAYKQLNKSDLISIPIGNHNFTEDELAENIIHVMDQLKKIYPGGLPNIRSMYLKINLTGTSAFPIYISVAEAPAAIPTVIGPREKRMQKLKLEANAILSNFNMTKQGEFVKLSKSDSDRKRKLKEMQSVIEAVDSTTMQSTMNKENGKQSVVPAKKSKTEKSVDSSSSKAEKEKEIPSIGKEDDAEDEDGDEAEQEGEDEHDSGEDDSDEDEGDNDDNDDDDDDDDDDDNDEDDDDDDDDDDEAGDNNDSSENDDESGDGEDDE